MTLISISVISTIIDNLADSDAVIQAALKPTGEVTNVYEAAVIPISNTKSRVIVIYNHTG